MSLVTSLATSSARNWKATTATLVAIIAAGLAALVFGLDREGFPPINTPIAIVSGTYFANDESVVDEAFVQAVAPSFAAVEGVIEISTQARPNGFVGVVEFEADFSSEQGTELLQAIQLDLPDGAEIEITAIDSAKFVGEFDVLVSVIGPAGASPAELQAGADSLASFLVADANVRFADVQDLLTEAIDPVNDIVETRQIAYARVANGTSGFTDSATVGIVRAESSDLDVLEFSSRIDSLLASEDNPLNDAYVAVVSADFAAGVSTQLNSLTSNLMSGLIAVLVVGLLLIGLRVALLMAGFMALVMLGALVGLWSIGYTLNTITLFGLILTLGLLVDNAVVVSESIDASQTEPDPRDDDVRIGVIRTAIDRVGSATLAGTLTTVVVFSPMLLIGGILGDFVRPIPTTVIITLLLSFTFAIVSIPLTSSRLTNSRVATWAPAAPLVDQGARAVGRLATRSTGRSAAQRLLGVGLVVLALSSVGIGVQLASRLDFSIFPSGKDANGLIIIADFEPGTNIESARATSMLIDAAITDIVGDDLVRAQYVAGDERQVEIVVDLTPIGDRNTAAPTLVQQIVADVAELDGARISVQQVENGPPVADYPFAVQITVDPTDLEAGQTLAEEIRNDLAGRTFTSGSSDVQVVDAIISTDGAIARLDGERFIEVRAKYADTTGLTGLLSATEDHVRATVPFPADRGVGEDSLAFDFGGESDNQDDFAALSIAGVVALALMLGLLTLQFRSLAQSLLVFLAIPFTFLGVTATLLITDNPLSFLAAIGFIALIGVSVNNTILLVDSANRFRRAGASATDAISRAVTERFRPLITTTLTTLAGLLPLALADPFWETLAFTLMGGLVTSTTLVLVAFPVFYVAMEAMRQPWFRRRSRL